MKKFYLLGHVYECGKDREFECQKNLGLYETERLAKKALNRYSKLEGFERFYKSTFFIEEYIFNEDMYWNEGFFDWTEENETNKGENNDINI